jgi:hypothetical protein
VNVPILEAGSQCLSLVIEGPLWVECGCSGQAIRLTLLWVGTRYSNQRTTRPRDSFLGFAPHATAGT